MVVKVHPVRVVSWDHRKLSAPGEAPAVRDR
jgi:hypothetical protein